MRFIAEDEYYKKRKKIMADGIKSFRIKSYMAKYNSEKKADNPSQSNTYLLPKFT